jgi:hypothetical protein
VDRGCPRIDREALFEQLHRDGVILPRERHTPGPKQRRHQLGLKPQRVREQPVGLVDAALRQIDLAKPHQRRHVVRLQLERSLK